MSDIIGRLKAMGPERANAFANAFNDLTPDQAMELAALGRPRLRAEDQGIAAWMRLNAENRERLDAFEDAARELLEAEGEAFRLGGSASSRAQDARSRRFDAFVKLRALLDHSDPDAVEARAEEITRLNDETHPERPR